MHKNVGEKSVGRGEALLELNGQKEQGSSGVERLEARAAAHVVLPLEQQLVVDEARGGPGGHGVAEGGVLQQLQQAQALRAPGCWCFSPATTRPSTLLTWGSARTRAGASTAGSAGSWRTPRPSAASAAPGLPSDVFHPYTYTIDSRALSQLR